MISSTFPVLTLSAASYATLCLVLYILALCIYRIFFHPLARYPGPFPYKLSGWPLLWQAYTGDRHIWHLKDHERYGPIVRIDPNTLSFNTVSALSTIYGPRSANVKKGEWYKTFDIAAGTYSSFTETDKEKHTIKRRWIGPAFSVDSIKANEPLILNVVDRFCKTLNPASSGWGSKWNMSEMSTYLGFDIMGALVFGCDFRTVQERQNRDLAKSVLPASMLMYWISYLPIATIVRPLLRSRLFELLGGKAAADNNRLIDYASLQVEAQLTGGEAKKQTAGDRIDFLSRLIGVEDKKTGWTPTFADLGTESLNMMNAGADPFSSVLAGTIFYLVHNPEALRKATAEVRNMFASPDEIRSGRDLGECTYFYACIEEALRRTAPVPSHLPRVVLSGGIDIDGQHLPAGTGVGVPMYAIHHDPSYFPEPFAFRPERWVESPGNPPESITLARRAFNPFSIGIRQCSGRNLAYLQLKLTLAHLLWRFDMRLAPGDPGCGGGRLGLGIGREREDEFQMWDALGFGRDGPMVEFRVAGTLRETG